MGGSSLRVLVVDDNTDTALSLSLLLECSGHQTRVAHTGQTALKEAAAFLPDAVVLDLGLPDMDGFEIAQRLRASPAFEHIFLVASTGYSREADRRRATEVGFDHYLVKPFDVDQLDEALASRAAVVSS
jgi:CheY-like chemotaxis protein